MPRYAELIYNGFWFAPEREMLQAAIDHSQAMSLAPAYAKLYSSNVIVTGRESLLALRQGSASFFEEDGGAEDQSDRGGFIKLVRTRPPAHPRRPQREKIPAKPVRNTA